MGFYVRKSISVGPLRFNLANSGVGVSAGVRGLRFGVGPRGNYVHMGLGGLYYRATIPGAPRPRPGRAIAGHEDPVVPLGTHDPLQEIDSADAAQIVDSSSAELLAELSSKRRLPRLWPASLATGVILVLLSLSFAWPTWVAGILVVVSAVAVFLAVQRDIFVKTVVVLYELEPPVEQVYQQLHQWAESLAGCARVWHIEASGRVRDRKYHAGAASLVRRRPTFVRKASPPYLKTNIETVAVGVGRQTLHFFPDRVLIYDQGTVGAVSYSSLEVTVMPSRFIETDSVPHDAKVVDRTWQYVNKSGGPDRRFKSNRQLPVCLYDEVCLRSPTGLNELIQVSRLEVASGFAAAIKYLGQRLPSEVSRPAV